MLLKRNVFRIVCALFYLPVALLSMFEIINLVMTNSQNRYFLVGGVVFGVLLFLIAAYFIKQKKFAGKDGRTHNDPIFKKRNSTISKTDTE